MRILLMISNNNMAVRELYGQVLRERFPGWGSSHMSGLPSNPLGIVSQFDAVVYELDPPGDPRRYKAVLALWEEIKERKTPRVITHIEGTYREGIVAELEEQGVICVEAPFTPQTIADALQRVAPPSKRTKEKEKGPGLGERVRGIFGHKG